nr:PaaI family thioesterase [Rubellimicrobium aerolatum]
MDGSALHDFLAREFPQVAGELAVEALDEAGITLRLRVSERHLRPGGTVGGPSIFLLGDVAAYCAILSRIGPRRLTVTTNAGIDFLRRPEAGRDLLCRAEVLKLGRTLAVVDARFRSDGDVAAVARANFTYSIPPDGVS